MGQEFFIKSENLESKVRELLPSQGGLGAGFDLTASTQIIPIVDLTESAEGSNLPTNLQQALSHDSVTNTFITNTTTTIISNTGYYRVFGSCNFSTAGDIKLQVDDGATTKVLVNFGAGVSQATSYVFDFIVFLRAGDSLEGNASNNVSFLSVSTRQVATIDGILVNP